MEEEEMRNHADEVKYSNVKDDELGELFVVKVDDTRGNNVT